MGELCSYCTDRDYTIDPIENPIPQSLLKLENILISKHFEIEKYANEQLERLEKVVEIKNKYAQIGTISANQQVERFEQMLLDQATFYKEQVQWKAIQTALLVVYEVN